MRGCHPIFEDQAKGGPKIHPIHHSVTCSNCNDCSNEMKNNIFKSTLPDFSSKGM